ncbi:MAG: hypothetical protein K8G78_03555, partial [Deltaproteobacteria bacterium]|nr:hypothetical protein [Candidatus Kapabacteria bacterium]
PATIKSRCLLFEFRRVSLRQVMERLQQICDDEQISIDLSALELLSRQGTGSVRDSISLLDQVVADPTQHISLELAQQMLGAVNSHAVQDIIQAVIEQNAAQGLHFLNEALDSGADARQLGQQLVDHLRQMMLVQVSGTEVIDASDEYRHVLEQQANQIERRTLLKAIRTFNQAVTELSGGWQPQLPLELAIVESTQPEQEVAATEPVAVSHPAEIKSRPAVPAKRPPVPPIAEPATNVSLKDIQTQWKEVIRVSKSQRNTLPALLEWCDPYKFEGSLLVLALRNEVLRPKLEDPKNFQPLLISLESVFGHKMDVRIEVHSGHAKKVQDVDDDLIAFGMDELGAEPKELE